VSAATKILENGARK